MMHKQDFRSRILYALLFPAIFAHIISFRLLANYR